MRLIDADALGYEVLEEYGADGGSNDVNVIYGMIINAPTVDAIEVVKQMFNGEMKLKLMPAEDAPFVNPYKIVLEDLRQVPMFTGKYDAKNGNEHFMFGILTVMEYIADKAGNKGYVDMFIDNMNKSKYGDKAE